MKSPETETMPGLQPLTGIRVVDFSSNVAGPYATMILAQLGADVVKVEAPNGDDARQWPPIVDDMSVVHRTMNAGKRGMAVDLRAGHGIEIASALMTRAHVVVQSMRPGVADRLGIGQDNARRLNPDVLYYDINAFGDGPVGRRMPGYDPLVQAFSGIMLMTGHEDAPSTRCAPSIIDLGTGQWVAMGVLAALLSRQRGQDVSAMQTALVDTGFSIVNYQATAARISGRRPPRSGSGNPMASPYECYRAKDGELLIAAPNQRLWEALIGALDAPLLGTDARFGTPVLRSRNRAALADRLNALLAVASVDHWIQRIEQAGVPVIRVSGLEEAVVSDVADERGSFIDSDGAPLVRLPWLVDGAPLGWRRPAPRLGEHTVEVLYELGYDREQIADLLGTGVVRGSEASMQAMTQ